MSCDNGDNRETEIRKMSQLFMSPLVDILEISNSWKKLMEIVPKDLEDLNSEFKYTTEHVRKIEQFSKNHARAASEVFLEEWGIAGRNRPKIRHLFNLLKHAQLYRAADFIAVNILKEPVPERPADGPAATVTPKEGQVIDSDKIETFIENLPYPFPSNFYSSDGNNINNNIDQIDLNRNQKAFSKPKIVITSYEDSTTSDNPDTSISQTNNVDLSETQSSDVTPVVPQTINNNLNEIIMENVANVANNNQEPIIPNLDSLLDQIRDEENSGNLPNITALLDPSPTQTSSTNVPNLSDLLKNSTSENLSNNSETERNTNSDNVPHLTDLLNPSTGEDVNKEVTESIPNTPDLIQFSDDIDTESKDNPVEFNMPHISSLLPSETNLNSDNNRAPSISDLLEPEANNIPHISSLLPSETNLNSDNNRGPSISDLLEPEANNIPHISSLLPSETNLNSDNNRGPSISDLLEPETSTQNNLESQNSTTSSSLPKCERNISETPVTTSSSNNETYTSGGETTEAFDFLEPVTSNSSSQFSRKGSKASQCPSPLPTLDLNTTLPHFSYCDLEICTNYFNENPYSSDSGNFEPRKLGSGAFGAVYLGIGLLNRHVAVKKLHLHGVEVINVDDTITKQFKNEVELLYKYKHENLLALLGYSCDGPTYCLVYEYVGGGPLNERLASNTNILPWNVRVKIAFGVAKGIAYLHSAFETPLIHRDIKSANILLDLNNVPKLCDFGLIKLSPTVTTNIATTILGTSAYMAPEAFRGDVSIKMDTFSYGVVLLELLTSLPPLDQDRKNVDLITHVEDHDSIDPLLDRRAGTWIHNDIKYSDELFEIANKCLISEKRKRPKMVEICELVEKLVASI